MDDTDETISLPAETPIPVGPRRAMPISMLSSGHEDVMGPDRMLTLNVLSGELPADIHGHMFVAGSIATPGRPAFSGEGTMYRIDITAEGMKLKQTVFKPPCFLADQALQAAEKGGMLGFHDLGLTRLSALLGVRTVLSNSPIALRDRMIITSDAGRPWEFDPITLELVTPIGKADEWMGAIPAPWLFPLFLTSAHPAEDQRTGDLFSANYANAGAGNPGFTHLIRWPNGGPIEHFELIDDNGDPVIIEQCIHQIVLTKHHVILQDSAFVVEMRQMVFDAAKLLLPGLPIGDLFGGTQMRAQRPTTVLYLIPRKRLGRGNGGHAESPTPVKARRIEIPGESVHFFAQYDDTETLELIIPHTPTLDVSEWVREGELMVDGSRASSDIAGMQIPCALTQGSIAVHTIDPRTGASLGVRRLRSEETWGLALGTHAPTPQDQRIEVLYFNTSGFAPELVPQRVLKTYERRVDAALMPIKTGVQPRLLAYEIASGTVTSYLCPFGWSMLSPTFVPRRGGVGPREGYIVCLAHSATSVPRPHGTSGEEVWIFDAADIAAGPLCRLGHQDLDFAFTVHSTWVPTLRPSPRNYKVSVANGLDLSGIARRSLGQLAFWEMFGTAVASAVKHSAVQELLDDEVLPFFDH